MMNLKQVAEEIASRLWASSYRTPKAGAVFRRRSRFAEDPHWRDLLLFHEYFHGDTGSCPGQSPDRLDGARHSAHRRIGAAPRTAFRELINDHVIRADSE